MILFLAILGAFCNRCRGGLINQLAYNRDTSELEWTEFKHADKLPARYSPLAYWDLSVLMLIPVGFLMGVLYYVDAKWLADTKYFEAEWIWGFILWGSFAIALGA